MPNATPDPQGTRRIVQGHPTGFEPGENKGGQNGAPKPDGRSPATEALPPGGADAAATPHDPGRGGD
jgi:hypothetical protein